MKEVLFIESVISDEQQQELIGQLMAPEDAKEKATLKQKLDRQREEFLRLDELFLTDEESAETLAREYQGVVKTNKNYEAITGRSFSLKVPSGNYKPGSIYIF